MLVLGELENDSSILLGECFPAQLSAFELRHVMDTCPRTHTFLLQPSLHRLRWIPISCWCCAIVAPGRMCSPASSPTYGRFVVGPWFVLPWIQRICHGRLTSFVYGVYIGRNKSLSGKKHLFLAARVVHVLQPSRISRRELSLGAALRVPSGSNSV